MLVGLDAQFVDGVLDGQRRAMHGPECGEIVLPRRAREAQRPEHRRACDEEQQHGNEDHEELRRQDAFFERDVADMEHEKAPFRCRFPTFYHETGGKKGGFYACGAKFLLLKYFV